MKKDFINTLNNSIFCHSELVSESLEHRSKKFNFQPIETLKQVQGDGLKAFTLAEIMIVLSVIAVLTAILLPAARNAMPNEKAMKFKKAYNSFVVAINELATSDKYYLNGDLGTKINGALLDGSHEGDYKYFCNTLADVMNVKKVNCTEYGYTDIMLAASLSREDIDNLDDWVCNATKYWVCPDFEQVSTINLLNDVVIYEPNSKATFGMKKEGSDYRLFSFENKLFTIYSNYKQVCIDIDEPCSGEDAFAIGLSVDGKIILSKRAKEWLEKSIQDKD